MRRTKLGITVASLCTGALAVSSNAQESRGAAAGEVVSIDPCINLETREQLLACYEERVDEVLLAREADGDTSEPEAAAVSGAPLPAEQATISRREERRAARETDRRQREAAEAAAAAAAAVTAAAEAAAAVEDPDYVAGEIIATITAIREIEPNAYLITLDNGQTWRQSSPKRYLLRVGAEVRLQPSIWGSSYRLTDPDVGNFIQVKRVR